MTGSSRLAGKVAFITGSGQGIGHATAFLFANEGAAVGLFDIAAELVEAVAEEIKEAGGKALALEGDVSRKSDVEHAIRRTAEDLRGPTGESIAETAVGKATRPEKVAQDYQLLGVCAKRDLAGQTMAAGAARDKLTSERGTRMAQRFLRDLRSQAIIDYR